jgi:hypothetical protein
MPLLRRASPARCRAMTRPAPPLRKEAGDDGRISPQPHSHLKPSLAHSVPRRGLSRVEAALYIGISPSKFDELRKDGRVGPARLIDGRKVWDVRDLDLAFEALPMESNEAEDWTAAV